MMPYFEMLPENNRRTGFFEQEHYEAVIARLPEYLKGVLTMGYWTEMRKAEMLGLKWDQVDLFNRLVFLERTKNGEDRTLPLNDELYEMLKLGPKNLLYLPRSNKVVFITRKLHRPWACGAVGSAHDWQS